jgi:hypothetical protein
MPSKIGLVSRDFLENAPLPQHGSTYTVISHKFVIDTVKEELNNKGFFIEEESYRATTDAAIATGVYKLTYRADPELSMAFAWTNSYNKQVKFKAVVGAISNVNGSFMILGEQGSWVRKHTGTADVEAKEQIINQVNNAGQYYKQLLADRDVMKNTTLTKRKQSELLGILFADYAILEVTCANAVKQQMNKPPFVYTGGNETLWAFYNHAIYSIQDNHPKTWLEEQRMIHYIITNEFNMLPEPEVMAPLPEPVQQLSQDPNQLDLEEIIAEVESEQEIKLDIDSSEEEQDFINQQIPDEDLELLAQKSAEEDEYREMVQAKEELEEEVKEETDVPQDEGIDYSEEEEEEDEDDSLSMITEDDDEEDEDDDFDFL